MGLKRKKKEVGCALASTRDDFSGIMQDNAQAAVWIDMHENECEVCQGAIAKKWTTTEQEMVLPAVMVLIVYVISAAKNVFQECAQLDPALNIVAASS